MATISKTGISNGSTIESEHITRIVDALDGTSSAEIIATGSFTGSFTGNMSGTASFATTASFALNAVASSNEYMTLRLSSGTITGVTSGSDVYIGTNTTSSILGKVGVLLPFTGTIISASVYVNTAAGTNASLDNGSLWYNVTDSPLQIGSFNSLDLNTSTDGDFIGLSQDHDAGRWITVSYTPDTTFTGSFELSADVLIKKT